MENVIKTTIATTILLQMVGETKEVEDIKELSYVMIKNDIGLQADWKLIEIF